MTEERIITTNPADGTAPASTHTTIIRDDAPRSHGSILLIGLVLLVVAIAGFLLVSEFATSEAAKDNAIAGAANEVNKAARSVGDAAQNAGEAVEEAAKKVGE